MKTGISTACFHLKQETEKAVKTIKDMGAECAEVFLQTFYEYRPEFAKAVVPDICGLEINSVHIQTNFEPQLFSASRRIRGDGFYWLDQIMRSAQILGAKNYTFHGFFRRQDYVEDFDALAGHIRGAIEFCARYGVNLCLENVFWSLYNRPNVFAELKSRCGGLYGVFDIKQARKSGYPYQMYLKDMAGAISHVHLSDVNSEGETCLPCEGITDFEEVFKRLADTGFDGAVIIEAEQFDGVGRLADSLNGVNEILYKLNIK